MDLTALSAYSSLAAAIGQVASAVAVVISLVYLALQLRHNTQAVQAQTYLSVQTNTISLHQRGLFARGVRRAATQGGGRFIIAISDPDLPLERLHAFDLSFFR